jgi:hypothetical protein
MIKKSLIFAISVLFSLNASAGYVQYNLSYGAANSGLDGFIVQNDTDGSIAFFSFWLNDAVGQFGAQAYPFTNDGATLLTGASTYFTHDGPTNFSITDTFGSDHTTYFNVSFSRATGGSFSYTARYRANLYANVPPQFKSGSVTGFATRGPVEPLLVPELDMNGGYYPGVPRIVPNFIGVSPVPEPMSPALLLIGAIGVLAVRRRETETM